MSDFKIKFFKRPFQTVQTRKRFRILSAEVIIFQFSSATGSKSKNRKVKLLLLVGAKGNLSLVFLKFPGHKCCNKTK